MEMFTFIQQESSELKDETKEELEDASPIEDDRSLSYDIKARLF